MSDASSNRELGPESSKPGEFTVLVGSNSEPVSIQLVQEIFNEITGKVESLTESFEKPYQIEFSNIENLYHRLKQSLEQYTEISQNLSAIIYYVDNQKDELSSFDRLAFHSSGSVSPVESIFIRFDFLLLSSKTRKPQAYTVSIRIASSIAVRKRIESDRTMFRAPPVIFRLMGGRSAYAKIEYIDYTVARNIQTVIKDWFSVLPTADQNMFVERLQKYSHFIPRVTRLFTTLISAYFCFEEVKEYMPLHNMDMTLLAESMLGSFMVIYTSYVLSSWLGEYAENSIDSWLPLSYIKFNKGDELEISKYQNENRKSIVKTICGVLLALSTSVISKVIAAIALTYLSIKH